MPAYNFKKQFVEKILDGRKPHTIRRRRKHPTKVGDVLYLYTGLRTKNAVKFAEVRCCKILPIRVLRGAGVFLDGRELSIVETDIFARKDGFSDGWDFFDFFDQYPFEVLNSQLEVIYWEPKELKSFVTMLKPEGDIKGKSASLVIFDDLREEEASH
jgi:hypothetical protein